MSEQRIQHNKVVQFTYSIADDQGNIVEQVEQPVNYIHGASSLGLIESVEKALEGHRAGDTIEVNVPPAEGFGDYNPNLTFTDSLENIPPQFHQLGALMEMRNDKGDAKSFIVTKIENGKLTADGNHPLAGKSARINITIVSVRDATPEELQLGVTNPNASTQVH
jgi:FKBP-type peptidyl-prolyl cis-trans isomerase SlyD